MEEKRTRNQVEFSSPHEDMKTEFQLVKRESQKIRNKTTKDTSQLPTIIITCVKSREEQGTCRNRVVRISSALVQLLLNFSRSVKVQKYGTVFKRGSDEDVKELPGRNFGQSLQVVHMT